MVKDKLLTHLECWQGKEKSKRGGRQSETTGGDEAEGGGEDREGGKFGGGQ